jgi:putative endonuclease
MIYSEKLNVLYKGSTSNLEQRFMNHLDGKSLYTSKTKDWKMVFAREFESKNQALAYEKMLKRQHRKYLVWAIKQDYNLIEQDTF